MYNKLGISPCYEKSNLTRVTISHSGRSKLYESDQYIWLKLHRLQEEHPVNITLYDSQLMTLSNMVNLIQQTDIFVMDVSDVLLNMVFLRTYSVIIVLDDECERREAFHRAYRKLSSELTLQYEVVNKQNVSLLFPGFNSLIKPYLSFISNKYLIECNVYSTTKFTIQRDIITMTDHLKDFHLNLLTLFRLMTITMKISHRRVLLSTGIAHSYVMNKNRQNSLILAMIATICSIRRNTMTSICTLEEGKEDIVHYSWIVIIHKYISSCTCLLYTSDAADD